MSESSENKRKKVNLNKILIYTLLVVIIITSIVFLVKTLIELKKSSELQSGAFKKLKQQLKEELKLIKLDLTWGKRFSKIKEAIETYLKDRAYDPLRQEFCESEFSDITFNGIQYLDSSIFSPAETPRKIDYSIRFFSQFNISYSCPLDIGNSVETKTVDEKKEIHCSMDDSGKISITIDEQNF